MNTHVSGLNTPMSLGELRRAILALVVGNLLFSDAEQLQYNHRTFDCETTAQLTALLREAEALAAQRDLLAEAQCLADQDFQIAGAERLTAEFAAIVRSPRLDHVAYALNYAFGMASTTHRRVEIVGEVWAMNLENAGYFKQSTFALN